MGAGALGVGVVGPVAPESKSKVRFGQQELGHPTECSSSLAVVECTGLRVRRG